MRTLFLAFLSAVLILSPCFGQTFGEITGVVTDPSGVVVANATVTVTNPETNFTRKVATNAAGNYNIPALLPGSYNISPFWLAVNVECQVPGSYSTKLATDAGSPETVPFAGSNRCASNCDCT